MSVNWRAWRLAVDSVQNPAYTFCGVQYFSVRATAGGASIFTGGTASASSEYSPSFPASQAFDDDNTHWIPSTLPACVQYDRGAGNTTVGRFLDVRGYPPDHGYSPKLLRLQGSNDGSTWTDLLSVDILGYTPADRWYLTAGTLRIPFGHIVSGNSTHSDTTAAQRVFINNWTTGALIDSVVPDGAGAWQSVVTGAADVLVTHIGDSGHRPLADGPVTPAAR